MQSYGDGEHIKDAELAESFVWTEHAIEQRKMEDALYDSKAFTQVIKDVKLFYVLRLVSSKSLVSRVGELAEVLRVFGSPVSYGRLASLVFSNYIDCEVLAPSNGVITVKIKLAPSAVGFVTQGGGAIVTQDNKLLIASITELNQARNDFVYLLNYLAPAGRKVTVSYEV